MIPGTSQMWANRVICPDQRSPPANIQWDLQAATVVHTFIRAYSLLFLRRSIFKMAVRPVLNLEVFIKWSKDSNSGTTGPNYCDCMCDIEGKALEK